MQDPRSCKLVTVFTAARLISQVEIEAAIL
jgi:hypothetical protein